MKRWRDISMSKFTIIDAFFVNRNKSSVPAIVPEQSKAAVPSTSFVMVAEIHNVDLNNQRQWCLPHLLLRWRRYTMLI